MFKKISNKVEKTLSDNQADIGKIMRFVVLCERIG